MRSLILVPTQLERSVLEPIVDPAMEHDDRLELCGFGPIAAAARTAILLDRYQPDRVVLVGIAGRMAETLALAAAYRFRQVACYGIGVGSCDAFVAAGAMGWHQWPGDAEDGSPAIGDMITCAAEGDVDAENRLLLTVCAASASAADVHARKRLFPNAEAEDMEAFAVAFACRLRGVPLDIVRGISNTAGDRDQSRWQTAAALHAAGALAAQTIAGAP